MLIFDIDSTGGTTHNPVSILMVCSKFVLEIQWMLLNGITLSQTITDPINRMILISECGSTYVRYDKVTLGLVNLEKCDPLTD